MAAVGAMSVSTMAVGMMAVRMMHAKALILRTGVSAVVIVSCEKRRCQIIDGFRPRGWVDALLLLWLWWE